MILYFLTLRNDTCLAREAMTFYCAENYRWLFSLSQLFTIFELILKCIINPYAGTALLYTTRQGRHGHLTQCRFIFKIKLPEGTCVLFKAVSSTINRRSFRWHIGTEYALQSLLQMIYFPGLKLVIPVIILLKPIRDTFYQHFETYEYQIIVFRQQNHIFHKWHLSVRK